MNPLTYALLAEKAYTAPPMIGAERSAARAIYEDTEDGLTFAIPGTNNVECLLTDVDVGVVRVAGLGGLHAGFWEAAKAIHADVWNTLPAGGGAYVLCGHSEGAAIALLLGAYCTLFGRPPAGIFAFEPPRVSCDDTLAELFAAHDVPLLLTRNGYDVITEVPRILRHWQHPGTLTAIGEPLLPLDNLEDHAIARVVLALSAPAPAPGFDHTDSMVIRAKSSPPPPSQQATEGAGVDQGDRPEAF